MSYESNYSSSSLASSVGGESADTVILPYSLNYASNATSSSSAVGSSSFAVKPSNLTSSLLAASFSENGANLYLSAVEQAILKSNVPFESNESQEVSVNGHKGVWLNRAEVSSWKGAVPIESYPINQDPSPEVINKKVDTKLEYTQEMAVKYLRPPTPAQPGEVVIVQKENTLTEPAPPLVIRQQPARPDTPEPLVVREIPPEAPAQFGRKVVTISGKKLAPPPRKVVVERLAPLPAKPQSVMVERWLPYDEVKRKVILQKPPEPDPVIIKPRNVIVQWEVPQVNIKKEIKYLGVVRADPVEYVSTYGESLRAAKDFPPIVLDIKTPNDLVLAADSPNRSVHVLEGDLEGLKLVDLDREGLSEYRPQLERLGIINSATRTNSSENHFSSTSNRSNNTGGSDFNNGQRFASNLQNLNNISVNSYSLPSKQSPTSF